MTAALARKKTGSAGASRGQEGNRAQMPDTTNPVAVLIRLPDLSEPASKEKAAVDAVAASEQDDEPIAESTSAARSPASEKASDQSAEVAATSASHERVDHSPKEKPTDAEAATWNSVTVPRPVMQLAGVLALIGMLIGAYFALVGGGGGTVDEPSGDPEGEQDVSELVEPSPLAETEPFDLAIVPSLDGDREPRDLFIDTPAAEAGSDLVLEEARGADDPAAFGVDFEPSVTPGPPIDGKTDLPDTYPDGSSWTQDDRSGAFGFDFDRERIEQNRKDLPLFSERPEDRANGIAGGTESLQLEQAVDVSPYKYPVTDPSNYEYPEDYHTMFQASPDARSLERASPGPNERSLNGRYPDTARLGPPIEPPPILR
ncbi:MAG: hypothetical protein H8E44_06570 [Planctomycetes bacterium]|nr:hypothetical protein [Planctomycetota bacterium]MBL7043382.1 hypothetical protein [Pirellulaceae bacterium]